MSNEFYTIKRVNAAPVPANLPAASTLQSAVSATANGSSLTTEGYGGVDFKITGTFVATVTFEGSWDAESTWDAMSASKLGATDAPSSTATTTGVYRVSVGGAGSVRARVTWTSGTSITITATPFMIDPLNQLHGVNMGTLLAGEDMTNGLQPVTQKPVSVSTYTPDLDTSAAAEASSVTKASPGNLYGFTATNTSGSARYWQMFNSTTVPSDATVPVLSFYIASGGTWRETYPMGLAFTTGMAWAWSSTGATKTVGSTDGIAVVEYK